MKTAPFDLTKALNGEAVVTRQRNKVTEIFFSHTASSAYKIITIINGDAICYYQNGKFIEDEESEHDLFMLITPIKKSCWVNIYKYGKVEGGFDSKLAADIYHDHNSRMHERAACIEISWEE